jgi:hypothetical protein
MMSGNHLRRGFRILALIVVVVGIAGLAVMALWNWLAPELFGWRTVSFAQALGLLVLCRLLIGGLRGGVGGHLAWRARLAERLERMTPEEREKFRTGLHGRCGWRAGPAAESKGASAHNTAET